MRGGPYWIAVLEPVGPERGDAVDMRQWLKRVLRCHGLRCRIVLDVADLEAVRLGLNAVAGQGEPANGNPTDPEQAA